MHQYVKAALDDGDLLALFQLVVTCTTPATRSIKYNKISPSVHPSLESANKEEEHNAEI